MKKLLILALSLLLYGCSENDSNDDQLQNNNLNEIFGVIYLPDGVPFDVNSLEIQSFFELGNINENNYSIKVSADVTNTIFVVDSNEEVILMSYTYPGQTDFTINTESTILAMIMNLPVSQSLSIEGKADFINTVKTNVNFNIIASQLDSLLIQGVSPLSVEQDSFGVSLFEFFDEVSNSNRGNLDNEPVNVLRQDYEFIFQNPGKSYVSYVGVYKEGQQLASIKIDRVNFIPTSIVEAIQAVINLGTDDVDIIETPYTLPRDLGEYNIKIRTGRSIDGTDESLNARVDNSLNFATDILLEIIPLKGNLECIQNTISNLKTFIQINGNLANANSLQDYTLETYDLLSAFFSQTGTSIGCLANNPAFNSFSNSIEKKIKWLKWMSVLGTSGNLVLGNYQLFTDDSVVDLCFTVRENGVTECDYDISGFWMTSITQTSCDALPNSVDQECLNHSTFEGLLLEFSEDNSYSFCEDGSLSCGYVFNEGVFTNSESIIERSYNFDGQNLVLKIKTSSSSGFFFDTRVFTFNGIYTEGGDFFSGSYTHETDGGLWNNSSSGGMILTRTE